jgi:hypothetical protein
VRGVWDAITSAMATWHGGKVFVEHAIAINHDALHVIIGVLLWVALAMVFRRPLSSRYPWLWLLVFILWNETVDLWIEQWPEPSQQYREGLKDVLLTMFLPTALMWVAKFRPKLFAAKTASRKKRW